MGNENQEKIEKVVAEREQLLLMVRRLESFGTKLYDEVYGMQESLPYPEVLHAARDLVNRKFTKIKKPRAFTELRCAMEMLEFDWHNLGWDTDGAPGSEECDGFEEDLSRMLDRLKKLEEENK